jgi:DNA-binding transcriptional ArsR family regulator
MAPLAFDDPRYIKAINHPVRARILAMLRERQASPNELASWLKDVSLGATSYHVRTLHQLGLIDLVDEQRRRGAVEHYYRAVALPEPARAAGGLSRQVGARAALQMISSQLEPAAHAGGADGPHAVVEQRELVLDDKALEQLAQECERLLERASKLAGQAQKRAAAGAEAQPVTLAVIALQTPALADQIPPSKPGKARRAPARARGRVGVREAVLEQLQHRPATGPEIAAATGHSANAVRGVVMTLLSSGQVVELDERRRRPGSRGPLSRVYALTVQ